MEHILPHHKLLLAGLFLLIQAAGADQWARLKQLDSEISAKAEQEAAAFTPEAYARKNNLPWPVKAPEKTAAEIIRAVSEKAAADLNRRYPDPTPEQLKKHAEERYPLYRRGDRITIQTFHPSYPEVSGIIGNITGEKAIIGSRWVSFRDLNPQDRLAFNAARTLELRQKFIHRVLHDRNSRKQLLLKRLTAKRLPAAMKNQGYVPAQDGQADKSGKPEDWTGPEQQFQTGYQEARKEFVKQRSEELRRQILPGEGYCKDSRTGKWRPMTLLEKLRH